MFGTDRVKAIDASRVFMGLTPLVYPTNQLPPMTSVMQAPFMPVRKMFQTTTWEVNDPLVHGTLEDLRDSTNNSSVAIYSPQTPITLMGTHLGKVNVRYRPWGHYDGLGFDGRVRDPGIRSSDGWDFSSEPVLNLGWLDRVHRGTPWQTIYFGASAAGSEWLYSMGGPASTWDTHPTNDWRLIAAFLLGELLPGVVQPSAPILVNNIIAGCTAPMGGAAIHAVTNGVPVVVNNILTGNTSGLASDNGPLAGAHHNLVWGNGTFDYAGTPSGPEDVAAPPMLVDASRGRFNLLAGSPCINAGDDSVLSSGWVERAGSTAVQSGRIDLGAHEFGPDGVPVLELIAGLSTDGISWTLTGFAGESYVTQASTNLVNWEPLSTNVAAGGTIRLQDFASTNFPHRFYRAVRLP